MPSLCDACKDPGHCCRSISLYREDGSNHTEWLDAPIPPPTEDWPWTPAEEKGRAVAPNGRPYAWFTWSCSQLQPDGRCAIYDRRPQLCRDYEPASTQLCVHYTGDR